MLGQVIVLYMIEVEPMNEIVNVPIKLSNGETRLTFSQIFIT